MKFGPGQVVHHKLFDYRGVVVAGDPSCQADDAWYDFQTQGASDPPPKDQPWYHVLVHQKPHTTYVAERNLELDPSGDPIEHELVDKLFKTFLVGRYYREQLN